VPHQRLSGTAGRAALVIGLAGARGATQVRLIVAVFLASFVFNAAVVWNFFFPIPPILAKAAATCLGLALVSAPMSGPAKAE